MRSIGFFKKPLRNFSPRSCALRGGAAKPKMTPHPRSVIAQWQYAELLQTCHQLLSIVLESNVLSRRDARWFNEQLQSAWDPSWESFDEYLAGVARSYA